MDGDEGVKEAKGVKKSVVDQDLGLDDYNKCKLTNIVIIEYMYLIRRHVKT